jgi:uncharacterized membrane protein
VSESIKAVDPSIKKWVYEVYADERFTHAEKCEALSVFSRDKQQDLKMFENILVVMGFALCIASIVFFFAYFPDIDPKVEFAAIELGILISVMASLFVGLDGFLGKNLLVLASVLVGVLFAHIGQVYQMGADNYLLTLSWVLMISPWVFVSRNIIQWLLWGALVSITIRLKWPYYDNIFEISALSMLFYACALMTVQYYRQSVSWIKSNQWFVGLLQAMFLWWLWAPLQVLIGFNEVVNKAVEHQFFLAYTLSGIAVMGCGVFYGFYRYRCTDIVALSMLVLLGCMLFLSNVGSDLYNAIIFSIGIFVIWILNKTMKVQ